MPSQTSIQNAHAIHIPDGCKVEIGDDISSLVDIGVTEGDTTGTVSYDVVHYDGANVRDVLHYAKNQRIAVGFRMIELSIENLEQIGSGLLHRETVAAAPVTDTWDITGIQGGVLYEFPHHNGDGTVVTSVSYDGLAGFVVSVGANGRSYITFDADDATGGTVTYTYTPSTTEVVKMGDYTETLTPKVIRLTNTDGSNTRSLTIYNAYNDGGFEFKFSGIGTDNPEGMDVSFTGYLDSSRSSGDKLLAWEDSQL